MTTRSIDRIISRLEQLKLISRERRFDGNKGQLTNLFTIANVSPKKASPKPVDDPEINQVLEEFTKVTGLKIINVRKQRDYAKRLLKREGKSNILDAIAFLQYISEDRYAPRVTDLEKLYFKWNDLMLYAKKKKLVPRAETKVDLTNL